MEDYLPTWISDPYARQVASAFGLLIGLAILWFVWKFFYTIFKHVIVGLFVFALGAGIYWYMNSSSTDRPPEVGKHVYGATSKRYLGKVQSVVSDPQRGVTYGVRAPSGQIASYPKESVVLKDVMDDRTPITTPSPSPAATLKLVRPRNRP